MLKSLPPSLRTSRVSVAPKTPFPFPFKRLPCTLEITEKAVCCLAVLAVFLSSQISNQIKYLETDIINHNIPATTHTSYSWTQIRNLFSQE